ncbi:MAG TPA: oligoendopeptidase F [Vicinamibacterales bacterium]|nr:oligoendopeptidase F [Vicinamibacterales bacterium]
MTSLRLFLRSAAGLVFGVLLTATALAQTRDRSSVPEKLTWNLKDLYPTDAAWRAEKDAIARQLPSLASFKGRLSSSASVLADALERGSAVDRTMSRLALYAGLLADQDTRDATHQGMQQEMIALYTTFGAQVSYFEPEVLRFPAGTVEKFLAAEPRLAPYRFYLQDIARRAAHTLSESEERLLASAGMMATSPSDVYSILSNADFQYPSVTLSDGRTVKLDQAGYSDLRALPNRADREKVMSTFFQALGAYSGTFGATMNAEIQKTWFFANARKYESSLEASLNTFNIPVTVYTRLVDGVNKALPTFHRYLKLRRRMMGVDTLHYYDLYAPLVGSVNLEYTPEQARQLVLDALAPLGTDYTTVVKQAFDNRWIDMLPTPGKRSGAYSNSTYDVHPYMLINYNGKYTDVSTVAHEMGHTMQSYFSNKTQPYPLANYPIFVAEVASTFNEALLIDHMLTILKDPSARLALLGNYLENIKGTVFRQTQFAEFEMKMHEMAQKGQPVTGESLAKLYLDVTRKYYGHDAGICIVDDYIAHEWSFIPHFYSDYYVFQYATSFTASAALETKVKAGDAEARRRYLAFISAGGSKYPIDLLKDAGVDMTTSEPLDLTMKKMNAVMDEMEQLLARKGAGQR